MTERAFVPRSVPVVGLLVLAGLLCDARGSAAQVRVRPAIVEVGGGLTFTGLAKLGTGKATMTSNQRGTPARYTFFQVDSSIDATRSVAGWAGVNVTDMIGVEVVYERSRPAFKTVITGDAEGVARTTFTTSSILQDIVGGNLLLYANGSRFDEQRTVPFALLGVSYLRQRDDEQKTEENGQIYQFGLGFKWVAGITSARRARGPGVRLDVRYVVRDGGFDFEEGILRKFLTAGVTGFVAF